MLQRGFACACDSFFHLLFFLLFFYLFSEERTHLSNLSENRWKKLFLFLFSAAWNILDRGMRDNFVPKKKKKKSEIDRT